MNTVRSTRGWMPRAMAIVIGISSAVLIPQSAEGATIELRACKRVEVRSQVFGSEVRTRDCGSQFTTTDSYIVLVIQLRDVKEPLKLSIDLLDPEQSSVWTGQTAITLPSEGYYRNYWIVFVLPVADPPALIAQDAQLARRIVPVQGKPARERLGEWNLNVRRDGSSPVVLKFTLQQA